MISTTAQQLRLALSTRTDQASRVSSEDKLAHLAVIKDQIRHIQRGEAKIHENYLEDQYLIKYWEEAFDVVVRVMFWDPKDAPNYKSVMTRLAGLEDLAAALERSLSTASRARSLPFDIRHALHQKWRIYDEMINAFHREAGTTRYSVDWPTVDRGLWNNDDHGKTLARIKQTRQQIVAMLWVNFAVLMVASLSFLAVGFFYSSSATGRWRDPDFWFLLQSSAVQLGGLFITGLSFDSASRYDWAAGGTSVMFALVAPVLYVKAPTQYSMLSSAAGGVFQALLIQQRAISDLVD